MDGTLSHDSSLKSASLEAYRARLSRALSYIQENIAGDISLEGAAESACFSKFHFHRIFGEALGESFGDCVRRIRLERAATFLEQRPGMTVTAIALASGFTSPSVLSRAFSDRFGAPPSRWRQERQATDRARSRSSPVPRESPGPRLWAQGAAREPDPELSIKAMPALRFASCLHIGEYGPGVGEAWERLYRWAGPRGLLGQKTLAAGVSWDNPDICPSDRCRYSACVPIPETMEVSSEVVVVAFPPRKYLCLHYAGPEAGFSAAYGNLYRRYLPESGFEPEDDPAIEFYRRPASAEAGFDADIALPVRPLR